MRFLPLAILILVLAACQTTPAPDEARPDAERAPAEPAPPILPTQEEPVLSTGRQTYSREDEVRLILQNHTREEIGYNLCVSSLERRVNEEWQPVEVQLREACPMILRLLPPGQSDYYMFQLDPGLEEGVYRFRTELETMGTGERQAYFSNPFTITR